MTWQLQCQAFADEVLSILRSRKPAYNCTRFAPSNGGCGHGRCGPSVWRLLPRLHNSCMPRPHLVTPTFHGQELSVGLSSTVFENWTRIDWATILILDGTCYSDPLITVQP